MKLTKLFFLSVLFFNINCREINNIEKKELKKSEEKNDVIIKTTKTIDTSFTLFALNSNYYPEGCGAVFSTNNENLLNEIFVFTIVGEVCYLNINNELNEFKFINEFNNEDYYENSDFSIKVKFELIEKYDEGGSYNCKLVLLNKKFNLVKTFDLVGEKGC